MKKAKEIMNSDGGAEKWMRRKGNRYLRHCRGSHI